MRPTVRPTRSADERQRDWQELGFCDAEQAFWEAWREPDTLGVPAHDALVARLGRQARHARAVESARQALTVAGMVFKLAPARMVAVSLGLMLLAGFVARAAPGSAAAIWAALAPVAVAALAWAGRMPTTGALGQLARQAPIRWHRSQLGIWLMVASADGLATIALRVVWPPADPYLDTWWAVFLVAAAVMLWLDRLVRPGWRRPALLLAILANAGLQVAHGALGAISPSGGGLAAASVALAALVLATYRGSPDVVHD